MDRDKQRARNSVACVHILYNHIDHIRPHVMRMEDAESGRVWMIQMLMFTWSVLIIFLLCGAYVYAERLDL